MKISNASPALFILLMLFACGKEDVVITPEPIVGPSIENEKFFIKDGDRWLWGGGENEHFNVSTMHLSPANFKYGLGRESFKVLDETASYVSISEVASTYEEGYEFIIVHANEGIKAYPLDMMYVHEVVNEIIDGHPVMINYCALADYIGVNSRIYCGKTFTFGVSGYTYWEEGIWHDRDGFVLWDRDTESLWWPLIGQAVSGPMNGTPEAPLPSSITWERADWVDLIQNYPDALVLEPSQIPPQVEDIPRLDPTTLDCH